MKHKRTILGILGIALTIVAAVRFEIVQSRKYEALNFLAQYGEIGDWQFLSYQIPRTRVIPGWLPGVWPRSLAINAIPPDPARYAAAVRMLPRLDVIMVFVYEPMNIDIFTALGAVPDPKILDLTSTSLNDAAFEKFTQFSTVEQLLLDHSTITDASMPHILKFRQVHTLDLYTNHLSDAKVLELAGLPLLHELTLNETVSPETLTALRDKRPDLQVDP